MNVTWGPSNDGKFRVRGEDGKVEVLGENRRLAEARAKQLAGPSGVVQRRYFTVGGQVQREADVEPSSGPAAPHAGAELTDAEISKLTDAEIKQGQEDLDEVLEEEGVSMDEFLDENEAAAKKPARSRKARAAPAPAEVLESNVGEVAAAVKAGDLDDQLDELEKVETDGKARKGVLTAIEERRAALDDSE